jgi:glycosyltransferase involved in cell wall biosynthesis
VAKLSAVLCNYNDSRFAIDWFIHAAVAGYDEIIVVDDESTDESVKIFTELQKQYDFRLLINYNKGLVNATIKGVKEATGEFVICCAMDDYPLVGHGGSLKKAINNFPDVDIFTYATYVLREGSRYTRRLFDFDSYVSPEYLSKIIRKGYGRHVVMTAPAVRKETILKCYAEGGKDMTVNFDLMYNLYAMFKTGFVYLSGPQYVYRSYPNSFGSSGKKDEIIKSNKIITEFMSKNLSVKSYRLFRESGICGMKELHKVQFGLNMIMKLPKIFRMEIYDWLYKTDWRVEKL